MRLLAVDTTSAHGSVALLDGEELSGIVGFRTHRPRHAESLLPTIHELLGRAAGTIEEVEGYAVAVGPGSFTGLRIGIAAVEGLAFATHRPVVGVSALEATAHRFRHVKGLVVSLIEAYRGEIYGASYRAYGSVLTELGEPVCESPEAFLDGLPETPAIVAGTGVVSHRGLLVSRFGDAVVADRSFFLAEAVARLGARRLLRGESDALGRLKALYIRPSEAERSRALRSRTE